DARAIDWAVAAGADVISCSWGVAQDSAGVVAAAINRAVTNGRNGKGCILVFGTGNDNQTTIIPGFANIISVGASAEDDSELPSSNPGEDLLAPGINIFTTDLLGAAGRSSTDYYAAFDKTSAATPHVAGVAALMLSVNPNLTVTQVEAMLIQTADQVSAVNIRVNALKAVQAACESLKTTMVIATPESKTVCSSTPFFIAGPVGSKLPCGYSIKWSVSPENLLTASTYTGDFFTPYPVSSSVSGMATIMAEITSKNCIWTLQTNVHVGKPAFAGQLSPGGALVSSPSENQLCPGTTYKAVMTTSGPAPITWTKLSGASSPNFYWVSNTNDLSLRFASKNLSATFRASSSNSCGTTSREYIFRSIDCGGQCSSSFQVTPGSRGRRKIEVSVVEPCSSSFAADNGMASAYGSPNKDLAITNTIRSVVVTDQMGIVMHTENFDDGRTSVTIDAASIPRGVYIVRVDGRESSETHRVFIE
ncbi:MAG TPA: S8 family peptidase, partial [Chryseosolibacter sp.]|nr:S8 family peptidase [Chryseosolibacter sp.]